MNDPFKILESKPKKVEENPSETSGGDVFYQEVVSDPTSYQRMRLVERSGTLDFWADPGEDVYSEDDGRPL